MQGVFVLQDNRFRWLTRISVDTVPPNGTQTEAAIAANAMAADARASQAAGQYLYFPCGLIRGALTNLGVACGVSAEVSTLPACKSTFTQLSIVLVMSSSFSRVQAVGVSLECQLCESFPGQYKAMSTSYKSNGCC